VTSRISRFIAIIILLSVLLPPVAKADADRETFVVRADDIVVAAVGEEVTVEVYGQGMQDLYGYEINVDYSTATLRFVSAASALDAGFAVSPIVKDGSLTYAYTKIGATTPGTTGSSNIAILKFAVIHEGEAFIALKRVKAVHKNSSSLEFKGDSSVQFKAAAPAEPLHFSDLTEGYWAKSGIEKAASLGLVNGYPDGTFRPYRNVTRAEFVTMLVRALEPKATQEAGAAEFVDADDIGNWARVPVELAVQQGWVHGFEDGSFRPNRPITRAEMVTIAVRALKLPTTQQEASQFKDWNEVPVWAQGAISTAVEAGLFNGRGGNMLYPGAYTNRAESTILILRLLGAGVE
jgi:hypothetical protein